MKKRCIKVFLKTQVKKVCRSKLRHFYASRPRAIKEKILSQYSCLFFLFIYYFSLIPVAFFWYSFFKYSFLFYSLTLSSYTTHYTTARLCRIIYYDREPGYVRLPVDFFMNLPTFYFLWFDTLRVCRYTQITHPKA